MNIIEKKILKFDNDWKPMHWLPKVDGYYMAIRCGLSGIYTCLDEWKNGKFQLGILDGSDVIAYSKNRLQKNKLKSGVII